MIRDNPMQIAAQNPATTASLPGAAAVPPASAGPGIIKWPTTGNTVLASIAWPLIPVNSSCRLPRPQPIYAILLAAVTPIAVASEATQRPKSRQALITASCPAIVAATGTITRQLPTAVTALQNAIAVRSISDALRPYEQSPKPALQSTAQTRACTARLCRSTEERSNISDRIGGDLRASGRPNRCPRSIHPTKPPPRPSILLLE